MASSAAAPGDLELDHAHVGCRARSHGEHAASGPPPARRGSRGNLGSPSGSAPRGASATVWRDSASTDAAMAAICVGSRPGGSRLLAAARRSSRRRRRRRRRRSAGCRASPGRRRAACSCRVLLRLCPCCVPVVRTVVADWSISESSGRSTLGTRTPAIVVVVPTNRPPPPRLPVPMSLSSGSAGPEPISLVRLGANGRHRRSMIVTFAGLLRSERPSTGVR